MVTKDFKGPKPFTPIQPVALGPRERFQFRCRNYALGMLSMRRKDPAADEDRFAGREE